MGRLRKSVIHLVQKTLAMEDPSVIALHNEGIYSHSQPMYDETEEILETNKQAPEKSQDFSSKDKIVNRHRIRYTTTRIKYSPTSLEIFYQTFLTLGSAKVTFIMKILS